jgi:predicted nucleic acid-binding protein
VNSFSFAGQGAILEPKRVLADFIIGAHALLHADQFKTLDQKRYRKIFRS